MKIDYLTPWPNGKPPKPEMCNEDARMSVLSAYGLDALEDDPELAEITRYASKLCDADVALVSLVEKERQRFLARAGLEERETPRPTSFCAHAMLEPDPMIVPDAKLDPRFETNPLVLGHPFVRFYAGAPLISHEGAPLGSLCVIDTKPRPEGLTEIQLDGLRVLASSVMRRLRHRRENLVQTAELEQGERRLRTLIDSLPDIAYSMHSDGSFEYINAQFDRVVGGKAPVTAEDWRPLIHPDDREKAFADWDTAFANKEPYEGQFRLKQKNGSWRWNLGRVMPVEAKGNEARWFGTMTDVEDRQQQAEANEILTRELSHRIKNIFAVIGGLVRLKSREFENVSSFAKEIGGTLDTLNRAHSYATQEQPNAADTLHGLLEKLLAPYGDVTGTRISLTGEDTQVHSKSATPLALVFHELATNCAKYGSFSVPHGQVAITTKLEGDNIVIHWAELGGPPPVETKGTGFGSRLVEATVNGQLAGKLTREFGTQGMTAILDVPIASL